MRYASLLRAALVVAGLWLVGAARSDEAPAKLSPLELRLDVMALRGLHQFQFTREQRGGLRQLLQKPVASAAASDKKKLSDEIRKNLEGLRQALLKGDEDRIAELEEDLEDLQDKEMSEWELDVPITASARTGAAQIRRLLSARQLVAFLSLYEDDFPDPLSELLHALDRTPEIKAAEWQRFANETGELVGRLMAGLDADKIHKLSTRVARWLKPAQGLSEEALAKQRPKLEQEARQIVAGIDPVEVLRNVVDHALAELLANPRLPAILDAVDGTKRGVVR